MSTGSRWKKFIGALVLSAACLCVAGRTFAQTASQPPAATPQHKNPPSQKKTAKKAQPPQQQLPSGPMGPVQQVPLDSIAAVPPQVTFQNDQLTIVAPNSTLADILRAVRKQTGADIDIPAAQERVVTHLGPGPAREVVAELLNGSRFNYVLLGSPADDAVLSRVVLVAKSSTENLAANAPPPGNQPNNAAPGDQPMQAANEPEQNDDASNTDDAADQAAAEAEQQQQMQGQPNNPDQPAIKTPQQMLQEMQQRQMQLQQQQQTPGQPPTPGSGTPPHPPQEQ